jgi:hypothetical protein
MNMVEAWLRIKSAFYLVGGFAGIGAFVAWIFSIRKTNAETAESKSRTEKIKAEIEVLRQQNDDIKRAQTVRDVADQMDVLQREQQKNHPSPILISEEAWIQAFNGEQPPDVVRDALRLRQSRTPEKVAGRFSGRFVRQ